MKAKFFSTVVCILLCLMFFSAACGGTDDDDSADSPTDDDQADDDSSDDDDMDDDQADDDCIDDDNDDDQADDDSDDDTAPVEGEVFIAAVKYLHDYPDLSRIILYSAPTSDHRSMPAPDAITYNFVDTSIAFCPGREPALEPEVFAEKARAPKLKCDADGVRHIVYCDRDQFDIIYANDSTGEWARTTIADVNNFYDCFGFGFALDAEGNAHVAYGDSTNGHYATNASGEWTDEIIKQADQNWFDLVIAEDQTVHATCEECINVNESCRLKYLHQTGGEWEEKGLFQFFPSGGFFYTNLKSSTFTVRDGVADIIYFHVWYQTMPGMTCSSTTHEVRSDTFVRVALPDLYPGDAKMLASPDGTDYLGFVYDTCGDDYSWNGGAGPLQLATRAGDDWEVETIDPSECDIPSLLLDPNGTLHFAYVARWSQSHDQLYYAANDSGEWQIELLDE